MHNDDVSMCVWGYVSHHVAAATSASAATFVVYLLSDLVLRYALVKFTTSTHTQHMHRKIVAQTHVYGISVCAHAHAHAFNRNRNLSRAGCSCSLSN